VHQRADHTVHKRLTANKSGVGVACGLIRQMLTAAKADFKVQWPIIAKKGFGIERPVWNRDAGQGIIDKRLLASPQLMALGAAIKAVQCCGIGHEGAD
jgi:hypothetical protein